MTTTGYPILGKVSGRKQESHMQKNKTARRACAEGHHIGIAKEGAKGINDGRVQQGQRLQKKYFWAAEQWPKAKGDLNSDHAQLLAPIACS